MDGGSAQGTLELFESIVAATAAQFSHLSIAPQSAGLETDPEIFLAAQMEHLSISPKSSQMAGFADVHDGKGRGWAKSLVEKGSIPLVADMMNEHSRPDLQRKAARIMANVLFYSNNIEFLCAGNTISNMVGGLNTRDIGALQDIVICMLYITNEPSAVADQLAMFDVVDRIAEIRLREPAHSKMWGECTMCLYNFALLAGNEMMQDELARENLAGLETVKNTGAVFTGLGVILTNIIDMWRNDSAEVCKSDWFVTTILILLYLYHSPFVISLCSFCIYFYIYSTLFVLYFFISLCSFCIFYLRYLFAPVLLMCLQSS